MSFVNVRSVLPVAKSYAIAEDLTAHEWMLENATLITNDDLVDPRSPIVRSLGLEFMRRRRAELERERALVAAQKAKADEIIDALREAQKCGMFTLPMLVRATAYAMIRAHFDGEGVPADVFEVESDTGSERSEKMRWLRLTVIPELYAQQEKGEPLSLDFLNSEHAQSPSVNTETVCADAPLDGANTPTTSEESPLATASPSLEVFLQDGSSHKARRRRRVLAEAPRASDSEIRTHAVSVLNGIRSPVHLELEKSRVQDPDLIRSPRWCQYPMQALTPKVLAVQPCERGFTPGRFLHLPNVRRRNTVLIAPRLHISAMEMIARPGLIIYAPIAVQSDWFHLPVPMLDIDSADAGTRLSRISEVEAAVEAGLCLFTTRRDVLDRASGPKLALLTTRNDYEAFLSDEATPLKYRDFSGLEVTSRLNVLAHLRIYSEVRHMAKALECVLQYHAQYSLDGVYIA